jgi:hypothetical protein
MRFFCLYILFVLFIMFSHHFFYVSLLSVHFKQYFFVFPTLEICSKFSEFPELTQHCSFCPYIYTLCVSVASFTLSVSSSMFVYPIDVFTSFP